MANHGVHTHALYPLTVMMFRGLLLSFSNQSLPFFWNPSLWFVDQIEHGPLLDLTDYSPLQCVDSLVMLIQWNRNLLPRRRFVSGALSCCRWILRLSTGLCLLTQGYGVFNWVFDPGINRVMAENEDVINLVETKKNSQAQWVPSSDPVPLFVVVEDEDYYDFEISVSNKKTDKSRALVRMIRRETIHKITGNFLLGFRLDEFLVLMEFTKACLAVRLNMCCTTNRMAGSLFGAFVKDATSTLVIFSPQDHDTFERLSFIFNKWDSRWWFHQFGYYLIGILRLQANIFKYWRDSFNKSWQDKKERVMIAEIYGRLLVVDISKCFLFVSAFQNQWTNVNGIRSRQWVTKSPSTLWNSFSRCEVTPLLFWSLIEWDINEDEDRNRIILKKHKRLKNNNRLGLRDDFLFLRTQGNGGDVFTVSRSDYLGSMETEIRDTNVQRWIGYYITHDQDTFQATYQCICLIRVMRKAFGSFIYKMLAFYKYMKRGLNRFYLLPVRLLLESRVTSTSSSKLDFNFLYLFQWLYLNCFMYHVSCKTFMK